MSDPALTVHVGPLRLEAKVFGPDDGVPVLALHGWLDNAASFDRLAPRLEGHRVVAVDLPGHGRSDHRPQGTFYHFADWIPDVLALVDALGFDRCVVMGHSMGASIAALFAGVFPERVDKVVLLEGLGPLTAEPAECPDRWAKAAEERARLSRREPPAYASPEEMARRWQKVAPGLPDEAARALVERGSRREGDRWFWRTDRRLKSTSSMRLTDGQVRACLSRIRAPVLLVRGEEGLRYEEERVQAWIASVPHIDVVELPGGHHLHLQYPERVAEVVRSFLRDRG